MAQTSSPRFAALDRLRGVAVAGMILVVSPGDWAHTYAPLQHAAWDGWTLADMVFPTFLFSVGVALGFSFPRAWNRPSDRHVFWRKLIRRVVALVTLGLFVEATYSWAISAGAPYPGEGGLDHLRIPGILQRIGLCYGLAAILIVATASRVDEGLRRIDLPWLATITAALLVGYWLVLMTVAVPGAGAGRLDPAGNLGAYVDRALFGVSHLWPLGWAKPGGPVVYDPEGLLSSLPATANVLIGAVAATLLRRHTRGGTKLVLTGGALLLAGGILLDPVIVINKRIWTSSFALLSAGFSALLLGALIVSTHGPAVQRLFRPLEVLGGNAILAFLLSTVMSRLSGFALIPDGDTRIAPQPWGFRLAEQIVTHPNLASLLCAIGVVALVTLALWPFHHRAIHFRL